ncbi:hypothetical protein REIS_0650 [Rickettsia endosymbiont of Ixodes scapularis]|nr:hypothetical protein REIS_0650 [Rickettsia endosymbiont of Ixodes scapularis]
MRGNCITIDEAISGVCYYFMRLPRRLRLLAIMILTTFLKPQNDNEKTDNIL